MGHWALISYTPPTQRPTWPSFWSVNKVRNDNTSDHNTPNYTVDHNTQNYTLDHNTQNYTPDHSKLHPRSQHSKLHPRSQHSKLHPRSQHSNSRSHERLNIHQREQPKSGHSTYTPDHTNSQNNTPQITTYRTLDEKWDTTEHLI